MMQFSEATLEAIRLQCLNYFNENGYQIINSDIRPIGLHFLAKNIKTRNNESFVADTLSLKKFVHTGSKREPWIWKHVRSINCPKEKKSYYAEMQAAIKK